MVTMDILIYNILKKQNCQLIKKLKNITLNKYFLIYSDKLLKRLNNEASIIKFENLND